jgi:HrpA-like RNA helicase
VDPLGTQMAEFPVEPRVAKMLLSSISLGCSEESITIAAMLSVQHVFVHARTKEAKEAVVESMVCWTLSLSLSLSHVVSLSFRRTFSILFSLLPENILHLFFLLPKNILRPFLSPSEEHSVQIVDILLYKKSRTSQYTKAITS